jgi:hypothetical protein
LAAVLLLPQPVSETKQKPASNRPRKLDILRTFVATISPTQSRDADSLLASALLSLTRILSPALI